MADALREWWSALTETLWDAAELLLLAFWDTSDGQD